MNQNEKKTWIAPKLEILEVRSTMDDDPIRGDLWSYVNTDDGFYKLQFFAFGSKDQNQNLIS